MLPTHSRPPLPTTQVYKREEFGKRQEAYRLLGTFDTEPDPGKITDAFRAAMKC